MLVNLTITAAISQKANCLDIYQMLLLQTFPKVICSIDVFVDVQLFCIIREGPLEGTVLQEGQLAALRERDFFGIFNDFKQFSA